MDLITNTSKRDLWCYSNHLSRLRVFRLSTLHAICEEPIRKKSVRLIMKALLVLKLSKSFKSQSGLLFTSTEIGFQFLNKTCVCYIICPTARRMLSIKLSISMIRIGGVGREFEVKMKFTLCGFSRVCCLGLSSFKPQPFPLQLFQSELFNIL